MSNRRWMQWILSLSLLAPGFAGAAEIRLYTIDKFGRQDNIGLWGASAKPGCHNFLKPREVYRVAVIGKGACAVYSEPDCNPRSKIAAQWKNRKKETTLLTPGSQWLFGEKEKVVQIRPEVDTVTEPVETAGESRQEQLEEQASEKQAAVSEVGAGGYEVVHHDPLRRVDSAPRLETIHIPLTTDVRSWQCVDNY